MYINLHVKYPLFLSHFNGNKSSKQFFEKFSNTKFHENPSSGSRVAPCGHEAIVAFRNFSNAPKKG